MHKLTLSTLLLAFLASACADEGAPPLEQGRQALRTTWGETELVLPWGSGESELGFRGQQTESRAFGPQAATLTSGGELLVLDSVKGRVVRFDREGAFLGAFAGGRLASDLAVRGEEVVLLDLAGMNLESRGADGGLRWTRKLSAAFKTAAGLHLQGDGLHLVTAHQESYDLDAERPLTARRAGVAGPDGRAFAIDRAAGDPPEMVLYEEIEPLLQGAARRTVVRGRWPTDCDAVRLVGVLPGDDLVTLCDRMGEVDGRPVVERNLRILSQRGELQYETRLATALPYPPFRSVRVDGGVIVLLEPAEEGLHVRLVRPRLEEVTR